MKKTNWIVGIAAILTLIFIPSLYIYTQPKNEIILLNNNYLEPPPIKTSPIEELFNTLNEQDSTLSFEVFHLAFKGYLNLIAANEIPQSSILTIIDFSLSSKERRLWMIDIDQKNILINTFVAHGKNSGEEFALTHSNQVNSLQSSPGFYRGQQTYYGRHGLSLRLDGLDTLYNDKALERAIVLHGADYASEQFITKNRRLGRSWGCPAVPQKDKAIIIDKLKEGGCLYIHFDDPEYLADSKWLNANFEEVKNYFIADQKEHELKEESIF